MKKEEIGSTVKCKNCKEYYKTTEIHHISTNYCLGNVGKGK